ncbi:MAG: helix-turn-helix domain-containing protein [Phenylobacterium sp.]|nr:helix-turn-helix domain-containing protein [Phenylobacterium sp.]
MAVETLILTELDGVFPANQVRSREAQARLLKAGERVFAQKGYDEAHVSDIAAAADCSVGSFYRRFRDKEALFRALHMQFKVRIGRNMARFLATPEWSDKPTYEVLHTLIGNSARVIERHQGFFRALFQRTLAGAGSSYILALRSADDESGRLLAAFLRSRGEGLGESLDDTCILALRTVDAVLINRVLRREITGDAVAPPLVVDMLTRMLAAGIGVAAPSA